MITDIIQWAVIVSLVLRITRLQREIVAAEERIDAIANGRLEDALYDVGGCEHCGEIKGGLFEDGCTLCS